MKPGRKKIVHDEPDSESPGSDVVVRDDPDNHEGIDAIRALMIIAGGFAVILLVWYILHNILRVI